MKVTGIKIACGILASVSMSFQSSAAEKKNRAPNIIYILADWVLVTLVATARK